MIETGQYSAAGTISVSFVHAALTAAARLGHPAASLLAIAHIPPEVVNSDSERVSPRQFGALWLAISRALDDEFFGLDSRRMKVGSFAVLARSGLQAHNLRDVLIQLARFFRIMLDDLRVDIIEERHYAEIRLIDLGNGAVNRVFAHETLLVLIHGLACWLIARRISIREATFAYSRPQWAS